MAERLGDAVLELRTDDSKYLQGVNKAKGRAQGLGRELDKTGRASTLLGRNLSSLGSGVQNLAGRFINFRSVIGLVAGSAGLGLLVTKSLEAADAIGKTADRVGLSVEGYQELRFAADRAGVGIDQFNAATTALIRRSGEAQRGNKGFADAFTAIGISVEELRRLTPDQLVHRVADALNDIESQAQRVAAADRVMSEAGRQVINVFRGGADALKEEARLARELGIVLDTSLIRRAEELQDEMSAFNEVLKAQTTILGVELAPALIKVQNLLIGTVKLMKEHGPLTRMLLGQSEQAELEEQMHALNEELVQTQALMDALIERQMELRAAGRDLSDTEQRNLTFLSERWVLLVDRLGAAQEAYDRLLNPPAAGEPPAAAQIDSVGDAAAAAEARVKSLEAAVNDVLDFDPRRPRGGDIDGPPAPDQPGAPLPSFGFPGAEEELQRRLEAASPAIRLQKEWERTEELFRRAGATAEQQRIIIDDLMSSGATGARAFGGEIDQSIVFGLNRMSDALRRGEDAWSVLGQIAIDTIQQIVFSLVGLTGGGGGGIGSAIVSGIGSLFGGLSGGGGGGPVITPIAHGGGIIGADNFPGRRVGAAVFAGAQHYLNGGFLGLKPGEVPFIGHKGEGVFTPQQMRSMGGGGTVNITNNLDARGADRGVEVRIRQAFDDLRRHVLNDIEASARSGGRFATLPRRR